ncbi:MAG: hypothetical protein FJX57_12385 [Alphaproteobacteria bacterium]|nr:hypothetical protein [Alphaproteobacteria bacterium]
MIQRGGSALLIVVALFVAVINTVYVGNNTIYASGLAEKRRKAHHAILTNTPPKGGWDAQGANGVNIRVGVVYAAEFTSRSTGIDVLKVYKLLDFATLFALVIGFAAFLGRRCGPTMALAGTLYLAAILPLTYEFHAFHPWDKPSWLLWLVGIWACAERRLAIVALATIVGVVVKYDILTLPLLYVLAWTTRTERVRPILEGGTVLAAGLLVFVALNHLLPGGHAPRDAAATAMRNLADLARSHITYAPLLAFTLPLLLAAIGWPKGDRFARAAFITALLTALPLFLLTNFREVRAEIMLLLLMAPLSLAGLARITPRT